jgi:hypothetical protein
MWNGAAIQKCGEKVLVKKSVYTQRGIPALGDLCCLTSQGLLPKSVHRILGMLSLIVFWVFAKKVLTINDSKV